MLKNTKLYQELEKRKSSYRENIIKVYKYATEVLPKINNVFANYTGHGIEHSISVMNYMYALITNIAEISDLEIACLIDVALLHDIGMAVNDDEILSIKRDELNYQGRKYSVIYDKYQDENTALQECVRPAHGERALNHIMQMPKELFIIPDYTNCNFQEELAKICQAHTMDQEWSLKNLSDCQVKGKDELNAQYLAMLLRLADYLDIDEKRAPLELYRFLSPTGFGDAEWRQHYIIENKEKVVKDDVSGMRAIVIYGECDDAGIHRKFLRYLAGISEELLWCTSYTRKHYKEKYWILLQPQINNRIKTKGFEVSDLKLKMDYRAVMALLMGEKVYGNKKCGLRELVQNAVDACRVMAEEAEHMEKYRYIPYQPGIQVILDYKADEMIVMDNGIGMGKDVLTNYFLNIGKSYYRSDEFLYQGKKYRPIGTFGVGFLACFMLSDSVAVETKHYEDMEGFTIELEKDSEYVCRKTQINLLGDSGTAIILNLKSVLDVFDQKEERIKTYLEKIFLNQEIPIRLITISDTRKEEILNLKKFEELNPKGIRLDKYLRDISVSWCFEFDNIKVSSKFSELCGSRWNESEEIFAAYDRNTQELCLREIEGEELRKYIEKDHMMALAIQGIGEEERTAFEVWKQWNARIDFPPTSILRTVYFPVKYDKSLLKYCEEGGRFHIFSGAVWHGFKREGLEEALGDINVDNILRQCGLLTEWFRIELGIFSIISLGNCRYIEYLENWWCSENEEENGLYWHGICLDRGRIDPGIRIVGVKFGKCIVNVLNKDIYPNVARDDLEEDVKEKVLLAVVRAALQYIADRLADDKELQTAVQRFIDRNYPCDNPYYLTDSICSESDSE